MIRRSRPRDVATQDALFCLFAVLLIALAVAKFTPSNSSATTDGIRPPGSVMVELRWPDSDSSDVDLWVQAPGDVPVGYSNKGGVVFNLLRDDLGHTFDLTGMNYENSFARGIVPGEYTVNLHLYRSIGAVPLRCKVVVSVQPDSNVPMRQLLATEVELSREGQERTALRFRLDEKGGLVPGSVGTVFRALREGSK